MGGSALDRFAGACVALSVLACCWSVQGQDANFKRGGSNVDGTFDISDSIQSLGFQFLGQPSGLSCVDAADANDDGNLEVSDAIYALGFLFLGTPAPPPPFEDCGPDPTSEDSRQLEVATDGTGEASVFYWVGSDAGCANNRVEVSERGARIPSGALKIDPVGCIAIEIINDGTIMNSQGEKRMRLCLWINVWC